MQPLYYVYDGALYPYDRALILLTDIRVRGKLPSGIFKMKQEGAVIWYDHVTLEDIRRDAALEAEVSDIHMHEAFRHQ